MIDDTKRAGFRAVMRRFPTGVTVVAIRDDRGEPCGLTVNAFTSVSLDPPLVLVCIAHNSSSHDRLVGGGGFGISILSVEQAAVAARFASDPSEGRFLVGEWRDGPSGHPILEGSSAWLDCTLHDVLPGGDHTILIGRVEASGVTDLPSMVYHAGGFASVGP